MAQRGPGVPGKIEKPRDPRRSLVRLALYVRPYKVTLVVVLFLILVSTLLGLLTPYLMGVAIDDYIATKNAAGLVVIAVWMLVVSLSGNLTDAISGWLMASVSQKALKGVRRDLFGHLQTLPLRFFDNHTTGELMSRLTNDIDAINTAISQNVVALLASVLSMVGILVAMFVLNFWLALASVIVVPIMFWFTNFVARYTRKGFRDLQKNLGQLNGVMEESISGQRVVKAFRRDESATEQFPRAQPGGLQGRRVCELIRVVVDAAHQPAGEPVRDCHRRAGRLAGAEGPGDGGHDRDLYQLRA